MFGEKDGLRDLFVLALHVDHVGRLWIAGSRGGLYRLDNPSAERPRFRRYGTEQGLSANLVHCVTEDRLGRIYACTSRGVDRIEPDSPGPIRVRHYTINDGLAIGDLQEGFCDRNGTLWFGTLNGLSSLLPEPDAPRTPPPALITELQMGDRQLRFDLGESHVEKQFLPYPQSQVRFDFVGPSFVTGEILRYQYRLEGAADADWSTTTEQRTITYANLSPGTYRFLVRALNSSAQASPAPAMVEFVVLGPIWRRW